MTAVESIPSEQLAIVLKESIGKSICLWRAAATVLSRCQATEAIDQWIIDGLTSSDRERHSWMLQLVGRERLTRFSDVVNSLIESRSESLDWAIDAAGNLCTDSNRAVLIRYANSLGDRLCDMNLVQSLVKCRSEDARGLLLPAFYLGNDDQYRIFAAWGLGQLGDTRALGYLADWLNDKIEGGVWSSPAAMRAAQALSAIFDWSLDWGDEAPSKAEALMSANKCLTGTDRVPLRELCLVLFDNSEINLDRAEAALKQTTYTVKREKDVLIVSYEDGPSLYIRIEQGDWVRRQSAIIAEIAEKGSVGSSEHISRYDCRFEITFANLDKVLMEINTLIEVQLTLQSVTNGIIYTCWNERLSS